MPLPSSSSLSSSSSSSSTSSGSSTSQSSSSAAFCVPPGTCDFIWLGGVWTVENDLCCTGYVATCPQTQGQFEGEIRQGSCNKSLGNP